MALTHALVTLNKNTPTIVSIPASQEEPYSKGVTVSIQNLSSDRFVFVGASNVSTGSYGYRIQPGDTFTIQELGPFDDLYAVSDADNVQVGIIRISL
jgi:hypothetical protein